MKTQRSCREHGGSQPLRGLPSPTSLSATRTRRHVCTRPIRARPCGPLGESFLENRCGKGSRDGSPLPSKLTLSAAAWQEFEMFPPQSCGKLWAPVPLSRLPCNRCWPTGRPSAGGYLKHPQRRPRSLSKTPVQTHILSRQATSTPKMAVAFKRSDSGRKP